MGDFTRGGTIPEELVRAVAIPAREGLFAWLALPSVHATVEQVVPTTRHPLGIPVSLDNPRVATFRRLVKSRPSAAARMAGNWLV